MSSEKTPRTRRNVSEEAKTLFSFNATPSVVYDAESAESLYKA